jgi:chemotaxis regulatin CheY-phosphate phosphatase CheZ
MTDTKPLENDIAAELRQLGQNIKSVLEDAWQSDERKKIHQEIEAGLKDLGDTLKQTSAEFSQSQIAQNLKADAGDLKKRVQSGELEAKVRTELLAALRMANEELKKVLSKRSPAAPDDKGAGAPKG